MNSIESPIIGNRFDDMSFPIRLASFLDIITTNCAAGHEELGYLRIMAKSLLQHQIETADYPHEIKYIKSCEGIIQNLLRSEV